MLVRFNYVANGTRIVPVVHMSAATSLRTVKGVTGGAGYLMSVGRVEGVSLLGTEIAKRFMVDTPSTPLERRPFQDRPKIEIPEDAKTIYVSNVAYDVTPRDLRNDFAQFGLVYKVFIPKNRETGKPRGFAFITMHDDHYAAAIEGMNGREYAGRILTCALADRRRPREGEE